jgi:hypothetical protein
MLNQTNAPKGGRLLKACLPLFIFPGNPYLQSNQISLSIMSTAGYSATPLAKKLGMKDGFIVRIINAPHHYFYLFNDIPKNLNIIKEPLPHKHFIHYFAKEAQQLQNDLPSLKAEIIPNGMIWISWPKKASKVPTDITEDIIRSIALANGLIDIKVCAIDDTWSALKLVIPVKDR